MPKYLAITAIGLEAERAPTASMPEYGAGIEVFAQGATVYRLLDEQDPADVVWVALSRVIPEEEPE